MRTQLLDPALQPTLWGLALDLPPIEANSVEEEQTLTRQQRFERFHQRNPHVYEAIVRLAYSAKHNGARRWSIDAIFHILRADYMFRTRGDTYKLNNDYTSYYSRLITQQEPTLRDFFEQRQQRT